eukprot:scaffold18439_cov192-Skeletonema_marinoi.AAC.7
MSQTPGCETYLFCLHKDPDDSSKVRPIEVPTAIRRIIGNHIEHSPLIPSTFCPPFSSPQLRVQWPRLLHQNNPTCRREVRYRVRGCACVTPSTSSD